MQLGPLLFRLPILLSFFGFESLPLCGLDRWPERNETDRQGGDWVKTCFAERASKSHSFDSLEEESSQDAHRSRKRVQQLLQYLISGLHACQDSNPGWMHAGARGARAPLLLASTRTQPWTTAHAHCVRLQREVTDEVEMAYDRESRRGRR
jgi:hypothetical protein